MMVKFNLEISESLSKVFKSKNSHATRAYKIHSMHVNNFAFTLKKRNSNTKCCSRQWVAGNAQEIKKKKRNKILILDLRWSAFQEPGPEILSFISMNNEQAKS